MAAITDASAAKRYLVKLEPGVYQVGTALTMKQYVDIEGSGQAATRILSLPSLPTATVLGAANAELRHLSIEQQGETGNDAIAFSTNASTNFDHVTLYASGSPTATGASLSGWNGRMKHSSVQGSGLVSGTTQAKGIVKLGGVFGQIHDSEIGGLDGSAATWGIDHQGAGLTLVDSFVFAVASTGLTYAFENQATVSFPVNVRSSRIEASGGTTNYGLRAHAGVVQVEHSKLAGSTNSIIRVGTTATLQVATTQLGGPASGTMTCAHVYSTSFVALNASCT